MVAFSLNDKGSWFSIYGSDVEFSLKIKVFMQTRADREIYQGGPGVW